MKSLKLTMGIALMACLALLVGCATSGYSAAGTAPAAAEKAQKPAFKQFTAQVDAAFVKKVVDGQMPGVVIDSRPYKTKYLKAHIPGSISLPTSAFAKLNKKLPKDKATLLIFYCGGFKCALSHKGAFKAQAMGYSNIKVYPAGYPDWKKHYGAGPKGTQRLMKTAFKQFDAQVDAGFVKKVADGKMAGMVIDSRPYRTKFVKGRIPGSISIPTSAFDKMISKLPKDKGALLIFYCGGFKCALSHKGAFKAKALGYTNIKVYAAGYPDWKMFYGPGPSGEEMAKKPAFKEFKAQVDAAFVKKIADGAMVGLVIDARPKKLKYDKGHIPGSMSLPTSKFAQLKGLLPADKGAALVFYCGGFKCALSHKAAFKAQAMGYSNVKVYAAGYPDWKKHYGAGMSAAKAPAKAPAKSTKKFKSAGEEGTIDIAVFRGILQKDPKGVLIIDVRDVGEFKAGAFPTAVNIPTDDLEKKLAAIKGDKPLIFVCSTGARSGEAYYMALDKRPDLKEVYFLEAEITFDGKGGYKIDKPQ